MLEAIWPKHTKLEFEPYPQTRYKWQWSQPTCQITLILCAFGTHDDVFMGVVGNVTLWLLNWLDVSWRGSDPTWSDFEKYWLIGVVLKCYWPIMTPWTSHRFHLGHQTLRKAEKQQQWCTCRKWRPDQANNDPLVLLIRVGACVDFFKSMQSLISWRTWYFPKGALNLIFFNTFWWRACGLLTPQPSVWAMPINEWIRDSNLYWWLWRVLYVAGCVMRGQLQDFRSCSPNDHTWFFLVDLGFLKSWAPCIPQPSQLGHQTLGKAGSW